MAVAKTLSQIARENDVSRPAVVKWAEKAEKTGEPLEFEQQGNQKFYSLESEARILAARPKPVANQLQTSSTSVSALVLKTSDTEGAAIVKRQDLQTALGQASQLAELVANRVQLMKTHANQIETDRSGQLDQTSQVLEQLRDLKANADSLKRIQRNRDIDYANKVEAATYEIQQLTQELSAPQPAPQQQQQQQSEAPAKKQQ